MLCIRCFLPTKSHKLKPSTFLSLNLSSTHLLLSHTHPPQPHPCTLGLIRAKTKGILKTGKCARTIFSRLGQRLHVTRVVRIKLSLYILLLGLLLLVFLIVYPGHLRRWNHRSTSRLTCRTCASRPANPKFVWPTAQG